MNAPLNRRLVDSAGQPIVLGRKIGDGGEGAVFEIRSNAECVAKIYHANRLPDADKAAKLAAMVAMRSPRLLASSVWPVDLLHESRTSGSGLIGLIMPKAAGRELHDLYGTQSRRQFFPQADWRFLVRVARNIAAAVDSIHEYGVVMGDVNQRNINVAPDATVRLMDCDSYQISRNGRTWRCGVGVPQFTPPELQGSRFSEVDRTANHDRFGLAVLIFHLLVVGYHPFMGRYPGRSERLKIEEAIAAHLFPYGRNAAAQGAEPPKATLQLDELTDTVASLFEQAFSEQGDRPNGRPSAQMWYSALERLENNLRSCPVDEGHYYPLSLAECPWCRIENDGGASYFLSVTLARGGTATLGRFDLQAVWARISAVSPPTTLPPLPAPLAIPPQPPVLPNLLRQSDDQRPLRIILGLIALLGLLLILPAGTRLFGVPLAVVFGGWWLLMRIVSPQMRNWMTLKRLLLRSEGELQQAQRTLQSQIDRREAALAEVRNRFAAARDALTLSRRRYEQLPNEKLAAENELRHHARERQLHGFLESHLIWNSSIPNIGPIRAATLAAYGVETAADVDVQLILRIPGFGPGLTADLLTWRAILESRFRFDAAQGVPKADQEALELQFRKQARQLERLLLQGDSNLQAIISDYEQKLGTLQQTIAATRAEYEAAAHRDKEIRSAERASRRTLWRV